MPSIAHLIHVYGLFVVAVVVGLESVGIPFPGETVLILAAADAGTKHDLNIASVILTAAGVSIIGRMIGYVIGVRLLVGGSRADTGGAGEAAYPLIWKSGYPDHQFGIDRWPPYRAIESGQFSPQLAKLNEPVD